MEDLSRSEYPAMLANLPPGQASQVLTERVKRINKINNEIADWLQERRKVEEQYVAGLRRLLVFRFPNATSELGVFQSPWDKVLQSVDAIAASHHLYATRIEKDVELPLRNFHLKKEMGNMQTFIANLQGMARELEEAQAKADKLNSKGGKANLQKVDVANSRVDNASQQWESQAPFIYESLQALDEQRTNHLRDVLTQLQTHEVDQATRTQASAEDVLNLTLEISTAQEIQSFAQKTTAGRPKIEKRERGPPTRQSSVAASTTLRPPSSSAGGHEDDHTSEHSGRNEHHTESKLRSRIGTMLGRRRQSIHGGFGQLSPSKGGGGPFSRGLSSSHGRSISPRASSHNLAEASRLSSLAETPDSPKPQQMSESKENPSHEGTNGVNHTDGPAEPVTLLDKPAGPSLLNGSPEDIFDAPPGPPPTDAPKETPAADPVKDSEGFTVPAPMNDPISLAQKEAAAEAAEEADQPFRLNIQKEPVAEEDAAAQQAAISNVASTLSAAMPSRKTGTVRGRRDVRNTIYMPAPMPLQESGSGVVSLAERESTSLLPPSPPAPLTAAASTLSSRPSAVAALASEASIAATSDTQSVRSATSLGSLAHARHPDMHHPGLNASIIETVSASFEGGELMSVKSSGEIAFAYNMTADFNAKEQNDTKLDRETIRINNFPLLDVIGPNRIFVSNTGHPDEFALDTSHLSRTTPSPAFTYRLHSESGDDPAHLSSLCPLVVKPAWRPTPDHKLGLLLQYRLNPAFAAGAGAGGEGVTLHNLIMVATYEGRAAAAQTKPAGTHLKDKHLVYWRLGDMILSGGAAAAEGGWQKIVCRVVGAEGSDLQPGHVEVRWEYTPAASLAIGEDGKQQPTTDGRISVSRLLDDKGKGKAVEDGGDDPFADDNGPVTPRVDERRWESVAVVRKVVSGRYEAK